MVRFQVQPLRSRASPFFDRREKQPTANTGSLVLRRDSHLGYFEYFLTRAKQGAAANAISTSGREEDLASPVDDGSLRIGKGRFVLRFHAKVTGDPFFIEASERRFIAALKQANMDIRTVHRLLIRFVKLRPSLLYYPRILRRPVDKDGFAIDQVAINRAEFAAVG